MNTDALDTMVGTPSRSERVGSSADPVEKLRADLLDVLQRGNIMHLAVAAPPKRIQSHDDDEPQVIRPFELGTWYGIWEAAKEEGREADLPHYTALGAVVVTKESTWILVKPEWATNPEFMEVFRRFCDEHGHEAMRKLNELHAQQFPRLKRKAGL